MIGVAGKQGFESRFHDPESLDHLKNNKYVVREIMVELRRLELPTS